MVARKQTETERAESKLPATMIAATMRFENIARSRSSRQRNGAVIKNRSIDKYGTIITGTNGIARSHSKKSVPTPGRCAAIQLQEP